MKLANNYPYNEKWDKKLNWLMNNSVETLVGKYTITFKVVLSSTKTSLFGSGLFPNYITDYATYKVWTSNKSICYGRLYQYNGIGLSDMITFSPSKTTMERLFELEKSLLSESMYD